MGDGLLGMMGAGNDPVQTPSLLKSRPSTLEITCRRSVAEGTQSAALAGRVDRNVRVGATHAAALQFHFP